MITNFIAETPPNSERWCCFKKKLKERYVIDKVIVTSDRGLNSRENLRKIKELGMDNVIAFRLRSAGKAIQDQVLDANGWSQMTPQTIAKMGIQRYKITEETRQISVVDNKTVKKKKDPLTSKLLINYLVKRANKDAADRQTLIDKAERYTENPSLFKSDLSLGGRSYLKVNADTLSLRSGAERTEKAGLNLSAKRITEALSEARLQELVLGEKETYYAKSNTEGGFEAVAKAVGLGVLPRVATPPQVKSALKLKSV